ncbi:hypothetical protein HNP98_003114 [Hymenobacter sp. 9A]|uniref:Uncharacterized protein n=1 Tax=Hymenobacter caeli TaxID=2735894 RepID=A0ABX2FUW3_9BACT|nr:hypothetical protein [Hymenobacter caeli]NRT20274.1 hypothetical protein [Hymenobacter caeli]
MDFAVNFNNKPVAEANEINNKKINGVLASKLDTELRRPQPLPQQLFSGGRGPAVLPGVGFGLVPGAHVGGVNMLTRAAELGRLVH